jgi:hypothetical protein
MFFAACNVAGGSPEKTAAKVVSWQRWMLAGKLRRPGCNRSSRSCFVGTPAAVPGRMKMLVHFLS